MKALTMPTLRLPLASLMFWLLCLLGGQTPAFALFGCVQNSNVCTSANTTQMIPATGCSTCAPVPVTEPCWNYQETWTCYTGAQTNTCSTSQLTGCGLVNSTPTAWDPNGAATSWSNTFTCPGQANLICTSPVVIPANSTCDTAAAHTVCNASTYGSCVNNTTQTECAVGPPPACNTTADCTPSGTSCIGTSPSGHTCETVQENYSCSSSSTSCVKTANVSNCVGQLTWGTDQQPANQPNNGFGQAETSLTMLEAIQSGNAAGAVTVFSGIARTCEKGTGMGSGIYANCCSLDVHNIGTQMHLANACDNQDILLAASRSAGLAVYIGSYCEMNDPILGCLKSAQTYCTFDNALAMAVNIQGRAQLAQMAAAGAASAVTGAATSFAFYAPTGNTTGNWFALPTVNGNETYAFQWPAYCALPATEAAQMVADPASMACPTSTELFFASCGGTSAPTCAAVDLPADPLLPQNANNSSSAVTEWNVQSNSDPLTVANTTVSRYVAVTGSCLASTGNCSYSVSAWPAGVGGSAVVRSTMSYPLYAGGYQGNQSFELVQVIVVPQSLTAPVTAATLPTTVALQVSQDAGTTFNTVNVPTYIPAPGIVLTGTSVQIYGGCDGASQMCTYQLETAAPVTAIPWGSPTAADCQGFTLTDLAVLDFSKMNLSQWLATIVPPGQPDSAALLASATSQVSNLTSSYQSTGTGPQLPVQTSAPVKAVSVSPSSVTGQPVSLVATANWPQEYTTAAANDNPVTAVSVDWGDGTTDSATSGASGGTASIPNQPAYLDSHTYAVPSTGFINYTVTVTFTTQNSGTQTVTAGVESYSTPNAGGTLSLPGGYASPAAGSYAPIPANTSAIPGVPTTSITP